MAFGLIKCNFDLTFFCVCGTVFFCCLCVCVLSLWKALNLAACPPLSLRCLYAGPSAVLTVHLPWLSVPFPDVSDLIQPHLMSLPLLCEWCPVSLSREWFLVSLFSVCVNDLMQVSTVVCCLQVSMVMEIRWLWLFSDFGGTWKLLNILHTCYR